MGEAGQVWGVREGHVSLETGFLSLTHRNPGVWLRYSWPCSEAGVASSATPGVGHGLLAAWRERGRGSGAGDQLAAGRLSGQRAPRPGDSAHSGLQCPSVSPLPALPLPSSEGRRAPGSVLTLPSSVYSDCLVI